ncbi:uncharacterized protein LOC126560432 [Anopheles maculipalpis]|uniref:uncharacterized protein LOC126560432 n=1 Tax=Anopheles maculipalpis TaxID=1496333 RepID=UPI0021598DFF|nr:uncharacterized protein LOC126560432 [Anopheles maculipalpis]
MPTLWIVAVLYGCSFTVHCLKLSFESFEQTFGEDAMWCDARVRKFNRTTSVLNGTFHIFHDTSNDVQYQLDMYYSRLGNQQYNLLPMKLPSEGICDFVNNLHTYYPAMTELFTNFPPKFECPISTREIHVFDREFPTEIWPIVMRKVGLWKLDIRGVLRNEPHVAFNFALKASND